MVVYKATYNNIMDSEIVNHEHDGIYRKKDKAIAFATDIFNKALVDHQYWVENGCEINIESTSGTITTVQLLNSNKTAMEWFVIEEIKLK